MPSRSRPSPFLLAVALLLLLSLAGPALAEGPRRPGFGGVAGCERLERLQGRFEYIAALLDRWPGYRRGWLARRARGVQRLVDWVNRRIDDRCVALNEIQVVGTHNSYHLPPRTALLQAFAGIDPAALEWEYDNLPLGEQFELQGIRQIELDVFADPDGGLYAERLALSLIGEDTASGEPDLDEPGFKVLHVQHADFETTCLTFVACLEEVKAFSDAHRGHVPIMILVEAKDEAFLPGVLPAPIFIGADELRELDAEIRSVFPEDQILTPDDVRGDYATLEEAILDRGWPKLGEVRGQVMFGLDNGGKRDLYRDGDPTLAGRVLFTNSTPGEPDAAFVKVNDPMADPTLIEDLVADGYIVRTRADAGLEQGRTGDTTRRDHALASGAQFVSTDFPDPTTIVSIDETRPFDPDYEVELPGGLAARCNPVSARDSCRSELLDR